jgi:capsular polysaccharide biosynthesis protein
MLNAQRYNLFGNHSSSRFQRKARSRRDSSQVQIIEEPSFSRRLGHDQRIAPRIKVSKGAGFLAGISLNVDLPLVKENLEALELAL